MPAEPNLADHASAPEHSRRGGRAGKRSSGAAGFEQPPFRQLRNPLTPTRLISDDELESIHLASLRVLKEIGVDVLHEEARRIMKEHGADVREGSERVRFDADLILELISHCPAEFTLHARNPAHNVRFGGDNVIFTMMASAPNCSDTDRGRRSGNQADYRNFLRLAQMHNILHATGGYPVEPTDIHPSIRHLNASGTSPRSPTRRSTSTRWARSATSTASKSRALLAGYRASSCSRSRRSSPSSTPTRPCASTSP